MASPTDHAAQSRILKHMNADHSGSLSLYLQHYAAVPPPQARNPTLTAITFTSMTIVDATQTAHDIPINPPLQSWAQARAAAVRMDGEARSALGLDRVVVGRYIAPRGFHAVVFGLCGLTMLSIVLRGRIVPGSLVYEGLEKGFPGGAEWFLKLNKWIAWPMLGIHVTEAAYFGRKVSKSGVQVGSGVWWAWVGSCFVEGMGAMLRFNAEVERLKVEEKKEH